MFRRCVFGLCVLTGSLACAQQKGLAPLASFPLNEEGQMLRQAPQTGEPFTVAGPRGVLVGQQQGVFEAWVLPVKLLSHFTVEAEVEGYPVPIDLNTMAREIEVRPDHTTITYSHIAVTVRQTMFAPENTADGTGAVVLFQVDAVRPVNLTFRFTPEMRPMWPQRDKGIPQPEWVAQGASGYYVLHTDYPDFAGAVAIPGATPGIMAPYQERPQVHPLEFHLHVAAKSTSTFPLLMAVGENATTASNAALQSSLETLDADLPKIYAAHFASYRKQEQTLTAIETPDAALNADFSWAVTSVGQLRARATDGEMGMVAGYYASGDSARPGFGWYFGRDTLYTVYAINSYGDFALTRQALTFLMRRQRADGKVMHEYSQTAADVDWAAFPYEYAAADATPLFLTAMLDYVRSSGDVGFLREHKDAVMKAWQFETTHDADGDGIYDNAQGTGWVESWPGGMPKQEVYLALLDEQGSTAMAELADLLGESAIAKAAASRAKTLGSTIEREYFRADSGTYAFSKNGAVMDDTATSFASIAWWNSQPGSMGLWHPEASLRSWASHDFDTDWGVRDVAESAAIYDPISYHQGSVWPLFTGWAAMAEYRGGHPLAGYQAAMQNADLTTAQDPGAVTELLSGAFYEPFGRSTSHQLWSSAMVVTPLLRGMFGVEVDALRHAVSVTPRLPADWQSATVRRLHVGESVVDLSYKREGAAMVVSLHLLSGPAVHLIDADAQGTTLRMALPAVEVSIAHGLPPRGSRTAQMKVLDEVREPHSLRLELEGMAGSQATLAVHRNSAVSVRAEGAELTGDEVHVSFEGGLGYQRKIVTLRW